ncbi:OsmC family peroxiredoxin [Cellulomonas marina]|uniref:OsmC-like protein n=1 Tax=Cellulomonas marina TaxID=988821 RepID=A0A1I0ZJ68_9CELL|nr:OsmC family peroxiredoxin [Cellulomonas marina]GIG28592.1 hypothetical protein Cma02nite_11920 [Cellulomonas marina]SFB25146.1 OsmC-like protein [Cellulomonas marina]
MGARPAPRGAPVSAAGDASGTGAGDVLGTAGPFEVEVASGTARDRLADPLAVLPHAWTPGGVAVRGSLTGAHVLLLAVAVCVLNDVHREAQRAGLPVDGVHVVATGSFATPAWASTGIVWSARVDSSAPTDAVARLLDEVERVAEGPRALAVGTAVRRGAAGAV